MARHARHTLQTMTITMNQIYRKGFEERHSRKCFLNDAESPRKLNQVLYAAPQFFFPQIKVDLLFLWSYRLVNRLKPKPTAQPVRKLVIGRSHSVIEPAVSPNRLTERVVVVNRT